VTVHLALLEHLCAAIATEEDHFLKLSAAHNDGFYYSVSFDLHGGAGFKSKQESFTKASGGVETGPQTLTENLIGR